MKLHIYHLYPDLLDLYGDRGNILALTARSKWRGVETEVHKISLGDPLRIEKADILFMGGGSDREQNILVEDLGKRREEIKEAVEDGLVVLAICGGYQMLGQYYQTGEDIRIPGLSILDLYTVAGQKRLIGNVIAESDLPSSLKTIVGFENHSGKTYLGSEVQPLARILRGYGNNGEDGTEGVRYKNVFGTYLHGPLLPKNPHLADLLLRLALERKGVDSELRQLDDSWEIAAHQAVVNRFLKNG
ncbi:CobB/CobQ domain protein glutamine amidotransferase [Syntrophobotulus glycolicus DSM 8271]|uniref:Lipid II isoglutaminyl synthase (glutamine-hydrolyzing) subunit GatD n=1 Tax=Syntrophobotulus glycolicus (strain DSM 8271 / FlGlyR) TaxID=645991 RepID=F0SXA9_SYNGF|nr:glutamine amidotransferase [Syntrophobotulus glycolicus]ADY56969.1 CobB/CobQ domain protein glutamine amidotransferase [Syntrophobotulus glycolicus DSM 8271]